MADTTTFIDYEFHFKSGDPLYVTAEAGKVTWETTDKGIELTGTPDETVTDTIQIQPDALNYVRTITRQVELEKAPHE